MKIFILTLIMALPFALPGQEEKKEAGKGNPSARKAVIAKKPTSFKKMPEVDLSGFTNKQTDGTKVVRDALGRAVHGLRKEYPKGRLVVLMLAEVIGSGSFL